MILRQLILIAASLFVLSFSQLVAEPKHYEPTWESLEQHPMPDWYRDAKFGIFIHWGVYSVPGWAPKGKYAEWYPRHMYNPKSPYYAYHKENYGDPSEYPYTKFIDQFTAEKWDPEDWAELFVASGAKYVVPVGEHHDGFAMWDSDLTEWDAMDKGPKRDIIGELEQSCRSRGLKYAPSYHRMLLYFDPEHGDGPFSHPEFTKNPTKEFGREWKERWEELRDKYKPDILWFDGDWKGSPETYGSMEALADYYNVAQEWGVEVVANDRFGKGTRGKRGDFYTKEYHHGIKGDNLNTHVWESCRGIGSSFGYNRDEGPEDYQSTTALVFELVDTVSKNGNLLLNIGPRADGTIPQIQRDRLLGIGKWLRTNGDAIYGTRPWKIYNEGDNIRFTQNGDTVYALFFEWPEDGITIESMADGSQLLPEQIESISMLGVDGSLEWQRSENGLSVQLPTEKPCQHAYALAINLE